MPLPVRPNEHRLAGDVAYLDVATRTFPTIVAAIDAEDLVRVLDGKARWTAHRIRGVIGIHRTVTIARGEVATELLHRHVLGLPRSHYPSVVHRDGDRTNCRKENLITTTPSGKGAPARHGRGSSKFKGVFRRAESGRYRALIQVNRRLIHLGHYATEEEAARAYDEAALKHHGELAYLNFPSEKNDAR